MMQDVKPNLPKDWEIKRVGDVCTVIAGQSPEGKFYNDNYDGLPFYQGKKEFGKKYIGKAKIWTTKVTKEAEANDILMSVRAPVGPINFATEKICIGRGLAAIRASKLIDKEFLYHFLLKHENEIIGSAGAVFNSINKAQIESILVPLPPLLEQENIVRVLNRVFIDIANLKTNLKRNLSNSREVFNSYLRSVFENKGGTWRDMKLQELMDKRCTLSYGIVQPGNEYVNGLPIVRPTDLTDKYVNLAGLKRIDPALAEGYKRTKLTGEELLLCVRGSTGTVSIAAMELKGANVTRGIVPVLFNSEIVDQRFGYYVLISNYVQKQIRAKTYGAALMQINIGDLRKIMISFPPLNDQRVLVQKLDSILSETKKLEAIYQKKIADLEELRKSILQKAFSGELKTKELQEI